MPRLRVYPGTLGRHPQIEIKNKKSGQVPLLALLVIFGVVSLFSIMAFFMAILALQK